MVEAGTQVLGLRFSDAVVGGGTAANYELQSAGPDGLLGTADDQIMPLAVYYDGTTATLTVPALPEGVYRLTVFDTITNAKGVALDGNGVAGSNWVRDFVVTPSSQLFASTPTYPTGGVDPVSIVSGDFTGNGLSDLAVANYTSGTVSVLLADGSGGFSAATTYSSGGSGPRALVAGDFNHDGNLDLAVANYGSNNIGLLLGNGQGGFAAPATFATGGTMPDALAAGDFNHDGKLDLAVANSGSNNVSVLLGNGHGGFATAATYGTGSVNPGATISRWETSMATEIWISPSIARSKRSEFSWATAAADSPPPRRQWDRTALKSSAPWRRRTSMATDSRISQLAETITCHGITSPIWR